MLGRIMKAYATRMEKEEKIINAFVENRETASRKEQIDLIYQLEDDILTIAMEFVDNLHFYVISLNGVPVAEEVEGAEAAWNIYEKTKALAEITNGGCCITDGFTGEIIEMYGYDE